ncbi:signal peptidase I [Nostocoides vanveenii]|uniref:Signal peptidase I n=1 Tax=Nostocoides vanveenii TaxID=330835 RepID=A0ABP4X181_9MICO
MTSEPEAAAPAVTRSSRRTAKSTKRQLPLWVHFLLALVLVALLRNFVAQSFYVPSGSMIPTLEVGDRVVVSKLSNDVTRGDIVVFNGTDTFAAGTLERFTGTFGKAAAAVASVFGVHLNERDYVKRVIGMPGDHVVCCDAQGKITINGTVINESYLVGGMQPSLQPFDVRVPAGRLWMMGDNRSNSADSRAHLGDPGGGMVPVTDVIGRPVFRYWPLGRMGTTGSYASDAELAKIPAAATK